MCLTLSKKFYFILLFWMWYKITHRIESKFEIEDVVVENDTRIRRIIESQFLKFTLHQHVSSDTVISNRCLAVDHWKRFLLWYTSQSSQLFIWRLISNEQFTTWAINLHKYWKRLNLLNEECFKQVIEDDQNDQEKESKFDKELQWSNRCNW
jgi:hypothetical protein